MTYQAPVTERLFESSVRIMWFRSMIANTQCNLNRNEDDLKVFQEKFWINTVLVLNSEMEIPTKPNDS